MKYINKNYAFKILTFTLISFISFGCSTDDISSPSSTPADFTTYVSIGNSLTAGYMDGAFYEAGQRSSYPEILAAKFQEVGGAMGFRSPFVGNELGGIAGFEATGFPNKFILTPGGIVRASGSGTSLANVYNRQAPFHNLGVPGASSFHLLANGYGNPANIPLRLANPHYVRFASSNTSSMLGDAIALNPTFFTIWIGNNDVLGYATDGGGVTDKNYDGIINGIDAALKSRITPISTFNTALGTVVASFTKDAAKGVIANIPNVTDVPYFTTITSANIQLPQPNVNALNSAYSVYNSTLQSLVSSGKISQTEADARTIAFTVGANMPVILDDELTDLTGVNPSLLSMRQLKEGELILLTAAQVLPLPTGGGTLTPLGDQFILTATEIAEIATATISYNAIIKNLATKYDIAFLDANSLMNKLKTDGIMYNGVTYNANFPSLKVTDAFSLDGVHPNGKGYAIIANGFLGEINKTYGTSFTPVNPANY